MTDTLLYDKIVTVVSMCEQHFTVVVSRGRDSFTVRPVFLYLGVRASFKGSQDKSEMINEARKKRKSSPTQMCIHFLQWSLFIDP